MIKKTNQTAVSICSSHPTNLSNLYPHGGGNWYGKYFMNQMKLEVKRRGYVPNLQGAQAWSVMTREVVRTRHERSAEVGLIRRSREHWGVLGAEGQQRSRT